MPTAYEHLIAVRDLAAKLDEQMGGGCSTDAINHTRFKLVAAIGRSKVDFPPNAVVVGSDAGAVVPRKKAKYVAIKVAGLDFWLWFATEHVKEDSGKFIGNEGWGVRGALSCCGVNFDQIEGRLYSEELVYE